MEDVRAWRARWMQPDAGAGSPREELKRTLLSLDGRRAADVTDDLRGIDLAGCDLSGQDLTGCDLRGADLTQANLADAQLLGADLRGATLYAANLDGAELAAANLGGANLEKVSAERAGFGRARLADACCAQARFIEASLTGTDASDANFAGAKLDRARVREANLSGADFTSASFASSELDLSEVAQARFERADLRGASLRGLTGYKTASWIATDVRDVDFSGAYLVRRFIMDQNFLEEFRNQGRWARLAYHIWWATSDCGRSMLRWALCTVVIALMFAIFYSATELSYGPHVSWYTPFYFSVVTLTTLGFGDIVPASTTAQVIATVQVVIGYVMLGGLISIMNNKIARRAE